MKRVKILSAAGLLAVTAAFSLAFVTTQPEPKSNDEEEILNHIHRIFKAYMAADVATIRATHSDDWTGFNSQSQAIVRGIDAYMNNARGALANSRIVRYKLEDVDVQVHGDMGIVYYVANWTIKLNNQDLRVRIGARSVDVYQKRDGEWIQIGSNLNVIPRPGAIAKPEGAACFNVEVEEDSE